MIFKYMIEDNNVATKEGKSHHNGETGVAIFKHMIQDNEKKQKVTITGRRGLRFSSI